MDALAIVTGASSGLGRAVLAASPPGSHRVDVSRSGPPEEADEHVQIDLADPGGWRVLGAELSRLVSDRPWRRVTLVHSAGTLEPIGFAGEVDPRAYTANVLLNSAAPQVVGQYFLAAVSGSEARRELVLVSSGAARRAYAGWSSYGAAKAAGDQWVRAVGEEQRQRGGVRVLSVAPGVVETGMQGRIRETDEREFPEVGRFRRLAAERALTDPKDAARSLWRLLEDDEVTSGSVVDLRDR